MDAKSLIIYWRHNSLIATCVFIDKHIINGSNVIINHDFEKDSEREEGVEAASNGDRFQKKWKAAKLSECLKSTKGNE